jgi:hypothetical protein
MSRPTYLQRIAGIEPRAHLLAPPRELFPPAATIGVEATPTAPTPLAAPVPPVRLNRHDVPQPAVSRHTEPEVSARGIELDANPPVPTAVTLASPPEPVLRSVHPAPTEITLSPVETPVRKVVRPITFDSRVDRSPAAEETPLAPPNSITSQPRPAVVPLAPTPTVPLYASPPRLQPTTANPVVATPAKHSPELGLPGVPDEPEESARPPKPIPGVSPPIRLEPPAVLAPAPRADSSGETAKVLIGSLEVRITAPPVPIPTSPPPTPAPARRETSRPATGLARGFRSFGLRQG